MGTKKKNIIEKINEGKEKGIEAIKSGEIIESDAKTIKKLVDSIDTSIDADDLKYVKSAEKGFSSDFKKEFSEKTDKKEQKAEKTAYEAMKEAGTEEIKVSDASHKFSEMSSVSEAVEKTAEKAEDRLKKSAVEYRDMKKDASDVAEKTRKEVKNLRKAVDGVFG